MLFCKGLLFKHAPWTTDGVDLTARVTLLITNPLIISIAASAVFFYILSHQTKATYVNFGLRIALYVHTSVEDLNPQPLPVTRSSYHTQAESILRLVLR